MSREGSTAATDDAGLFNTFNDLCLVKFFPIFFIRQPVRPFIKAVSLDYDSHARNHHVMRHGSYLNDFAGCGCMNVGMQKCITRPY